MSRQHSQSKRHNSPSEAPKVSNQDSPAKRPSAAVLRTSKAEIVLANAESELHLAKQLARSLPNLADIIISNSSHHRAELLGNLSAIEEQAQVVADVVNSIQTKNLKSELRAEVARCKNETNEILAVTTDLKKRAEGLSGVPDVSHTDPPLLSRRQELELVNEMIRRRGLFWEKMFDIPFVRERHLEDLSRVAATQLQPASAIFSYRSENEDGDALLEKARHVTEEIRKLVGDREVRALPSPVQARINALLMTAPAIPERMVRAFTELKELSSSLTVLESKLICRYGSVQAACDAGDVGAQECVSLQKNLGGAALSVFETVSRIQTLFTPYMDLKNYLVLANKRLVFSTVLSSERMRKNIDDLSQEGIFGLMRAIEKFDPTSGFKLSTYAVWWIRQITARAHESSAHLITVPAHNLGGFTALQAILKNSPEYPSIQSLAERTGLSERDVAALLPLLPGVGSINSKTKAGSDQTREDLIADSKAPDVTRLPHEKELKQVVNDVLKSLSDRERTVLELRFGLSGEPPLTLEEVGQRLGVTRERVRQIQSKARLKLRHLTSRDDRLAVLFFKLRE